MYEFNYKKAGSLDEAKALLAGADDGKLLSGGQTLLPTMKQRLAMPSDLIDIGSLAELKGIAVSGDVLSIGAGEKHADVASSSEIRSALPALADLAGMIGDPHVRHMGTLGGSISNNDPAADYPAACVGLDATIHTTDRSLSAEEFFVGMFETALSETEIVVGVDFKVPQKAAYMKFPNPASRYAIVGVMVAQYASGPRVAVTGAGPSVFRQMEMEQALASDFSPGSIEAIRQSPESLNSDLHASADYRAHLVGVMAKRAVEKAS